MMVRTASRSASCGQSVFPFVHWQWISTLLLLGATLTTAPPTLVAQQTQPISSHTPGRAPYWVSIDTASTSQSNGVGSGTITGGALLKKGGKGGHVTTSSVLSSENLIVDSLNMMGVGRDANVCANSCFSMSYAQSTVPYYSLDTPRQITLMYNSEVTAPRPVLFTDVRINSSSTKTLKEYWLQLQLNGVTVTFLNGDTKLRFNAPSPQTTSVRLAGQFDNRTMPTGLDSLSIIITAVWNDNSTQQMTFTGWFINLNGATSPVGRGWFIGGLQQLYVQPNGRILIVNGDGSAGQFTPLGGGAYHTETNTDFSLLTSSGSGSSTVYTRTYPDSSRVQFDNTGKALRSISTTLDTVSYGYDGAGRLTKVYDPFRTYSGGASRSYITLHYTTGGLLDQIQEPGGDGTPGNGRVTNITIATSDSTVTSIQDPDGVSTNFHYNSNKLLDKLINRHSDTTRYVYNTNSWLLDSLVSPRVPVDAGGGSTTNQTPAMAYTPWHTIGIPTSSTATTAATAALTSSIKATIHDPISRVVTYTVNVDGKKLVVTAPQSQTTTIVRDGSWTELPLKVTHPTSGTDTLTFTANTPNLTYAVPAGDSAANVHYGVSGQADSAWALGQLARKAFLNSTTALPDSLRLGGKDSLVMHFTYDSQRRVATTKDVSGHQRGYHYDPVFGNIDSTNVPGSAYVRRLFDAFGRDTAHFSKGATYWVRMQYDTLNREVRHWHAGFTGDTSVTTYDASFVTRLRVPRGGTIYKIETDALGHVTKRYDGVDTTRSSTYRFDAAGRMTSWTNRRGQRIDILYDSLNRVIRQSGTNTPTDTFTYSSNNRIQTAARGTVSLDSTFFNLAGRVDSVVHRIGGHRYAFLTTYGKSSNAQQGSVTITSDAGITWVQASEAVHVGSTSQDSITLSPGTGVGTVVWTLNRDNVPTQVQWPSGVPNRTTGYTSLIKSYTVGFGGSGALSDSLSRDYQRDTLSRVVKEWRKTGSGFEQRIYVFDGLGRLTKVSRAALSSCTVTADSITGASYSCSTNTTLATQDSLGYDTGGNRNVPGATQSSTGNQLLTWPTSSGTITYTYDADGNMATRAHNGVTDSLFWSATNQLDSVRSGGLRRRYEYNSAGYPVRRSTNGNLDRLWLWAGDQLIAELDSAGTHRRAQYLYRGTDHPYAIVTDSAGSPLVRYLQQDQLGSVVGVMRGNALAQFTRYTAWGQIDAQPINTVADTNRLGWKGLVYDGDSTRMYFARNRWYDPQMGRFASEDPTGLDGGGNLYTFAGNDPIDGWDAEGTCAYQLPDGTTGDAPIGSTGIQYGGPVFCNSQDQWQDGVPPANLAPVVITGQSPWWYGPYGCMVCFSSYGPDNPLPLQYAPWYEPPPPPRTTGQCFSENTAWLTDFITSKTGLAIDASVPLLYGISKFLKNISDEVTMNGSFDLDEFFFTSESSSMFMERAMATVAAGSTLSSLSQLLLRTSAYAAVGVAGFVGSYYLTSYLLCSANPNYGQ